MRDVIVIGGGGGGPVVAKELAARGLDVLLLEAGPRHADPEREWSHFENETAGRFRWGPADRTRPPWLREIPHNGTVTQLSGVGGTTQHYAANSPRAMPGAFAGYTGSDAAAYDVAHRFPFTYRELLPYYQWVEYTLPVQTAPVGTKEAFFFRGAERLGLPLNTTKDITQDSFRPQENAILQPGGTAGRTTDASRLVWPEAQGCTLCGYCIEGCYEPRQAPRNLKAKRSTDNSYVPMALTASRWQPGGRDVTLLTDAFATAIGTMRHRGETVAHHVTWRVGATGETITEEARVIVLAGGATESPRLWLNSRLPNPNDWVGRGYTDHFIDGVMGEFNEDTGTFRGPFSGPRIDFPGRGFIFNAGMPPALLALFSGFSDGGIAGFYDNGRPDASSAGTSGRLIGNRFADFMSGADRLLTVAVVTDDDVEADNRVTLSRALPPDEHGAIPKIFFDHRHRSARTVANREFLLRKAVELLRAMGARAVHRGNLPPLGLHTMSTMRMGHDPADSVCDGNGAARAVRHLYIADNSVLANSLGGPNPTLTTQAVATRTAERIFTLEFGGQPWVGKEAPVSSIDPAVTDAVRQQ
ncbi:MAG TPA: GMC family oxidoreductase [Acidimicrobiia bacterium]|nr:GMC family oxidoreductase [Acidimicrobiia bacterium]